MQSSVKFTPRKDHKAQNDLMLALLFFSLVLDEVVGERHSPAPLIPRKWSDIYCTCGWVGARTILDECVKSRTHWDSIPGPAQPIPISYTANAGLTNAYEIFLQSVLWFIQNGEKALWLTNFKMFLALSSDVSASQYTDVRKVIFEIL